MQIDNSTIVSVGALLTALGTRDFVLSRIQKKRNALTDENLEVAAKKAVAETNSIEVNTVRDVLNEMNQYRGTLTAQISELADKIKVLEDRERHMLTRAATHEAWDRMSFSMLLQLNPNHPPPPPLVSLDDLEALEDHQHEAQLKAAGESGPEETH